MKNFLLITIAFFFTVSSFSQTDSVAKTGKKFIPSMATIRTTDGRKTKGWFYKMNDENIYLLPAQRNKKYFRTSDFTSPDLNARAFNIQASQINTIALQKRNATLKGTLIGLGAGVITGVVVGFASGDDPVEQYQGDFVDIFRSINNAFAMTAGEKALAGAIGFGTAGALAGFIISKIAKKKFIIGAKKEVYHDLQAELMQRLIIK